MNSGGIHEFEVWLGRFWSPNPKFTNWLSYMSWISN